MRKTSIYLSAKQVNRVAEVARLEGRSQAEVIRAAIDSYTPATADREFVLAAGFARSDDDPRPISEIPDEELLRGFGE